MRYSKAHWIAVAVLVGAALAACEKGTNMGVDDVDPEFVVNTHEEGDQMNPVVAALPSGQFVVVWESGCLHECDGQDGDQFGVYGRRFDPDGLPLGGEFRVNDQIDFSQQDPSVAMLADGRFVIAWATEGQVTTDEWDVRLKFYGSAGVELTEEIAVNEETEFNQWRPKVAISDDGAALVVWEHHDANGARIMARRFDFDGSPRGPSTPISDTGGWGGAVEPGLSGLADGRGVAVWSAGGIMAQRLDGDQPVGAPIEVSSGMTATYPMPAVSMSPTGDFVVVWSGSHGEDWGGYDIVARVFSADASAITEEIAVNEDASGLQMQPTVAVSMDGDRFVVSWESELDNGANNEILAKVYLLDGTVTEPDFTVNSYQADMQDAPAACPTRDGFLLAWQSSPEEGTGYNVYIKLFPIWP